jgi:hypothetical protein
MQSATMIATVSPNRDRIVAYSTHSGASKAYRAPKGVRIVPITSQSVIALDMTGEEIAQVAVFSAKTSKWYPIDLKEPARRQAQPIVGEGLVAYYVGRRAYAFSDEAERWDVLELSEGAVAVPIVSSTYATVEHDGRLYVFSAKTGTWAEASPKDDDTPGTP